MVVIIWNGIVYNSAAFNQYGFFQAQIAKQTQENLHISLLIHFNLLNNTLELGIVHLTNVRYILYLFKCMILNIFKLLFLGQMIGYHFQLVFQSFYLFSRTADFIIQFLSGNQVIGVHIHIFLSGFCQLV